MKNAEAWTPSKFVLRRGELRASRDPKEVGIASRVMADLIGAFYQRALKQHCRGRLLDLGCGKVPLYLAYRELVSENVCVDWAQSMHKNAFLDVECDLSQALPFEDAAFDTIILSDVLEHIATPEKLWQEMTRILRPGGKILMNSPFFYSLHETPHDYYRYTEFALRRFCELNNLTVVEISALGGAPEILADVMAKNLMRAAAPGRAAASFLQRLCWAVGRTRLGAKISRSSADGFPFAYAMIAQK